MANNAPATASELRRYANALSARRNDLADVRRQFDRIRDDIDWESKYAKRWKERAHERIAVLDVRIAALDDLIGALHRAASRA